MNLYKNSYRSFSPPLLLGEGRRQSRSFALADPQVPYGQTNYPTIIPTPVEATPTKKPYYRSEKGAQHYRQAQTARSRAAKMPNCVQ